jgi:benzoyl-CoA reductase/2-hydroxyglutaryl-CoA dehydratase subunit BcrC/BadD/HgdB
LQACHTYNVESEFVKRYVTQEKGLGYLCIETDYSQSDSGQISTRLNAFLETLEN